MQRTIQVWAVSVAVVLLAAMSAQAAPVTIFSNFNSDPTNLYDANGYWFVFAPAIRAGGLSAAMGFTPSDADVLTQIDVAITLYSGTSLLDFGLYSDSGGVPGSLLTSWSIASLPAAGTCCTVETLVPGTSITLNAGVQYWLLASVSQDTMALWNTNNIGQQGPEWSTGVGASTQTEGAFDVLGDPVPEPASALLVTCGVALLGLVVRRRQRG
jgi:hypothetical protein